MSLVVVGSVAYDGVETPHGRVDRMLGGAATYISLSASFFTKTRLVGIVGDDFASEDTAALQAAFDPAWESAVPYTVLIAPDGKVLYKKQGSVDMLELRRTILASMPSDYEGFNKYWSEQ